LHPQIIINQHILAQQAQQLHQHKLQQLQQQELQIQQAHQLQLQQELQIQQAHQLQLQQELQLQLQLQEEKQEEEKQTLRLTREFGNNLILNYKQTRQTIELEPELDITYLASLSSLLPESYTLLGTTPYPMNILDQGNLGACVVNAFAGITQCLTGKTPSRLYLYFNARVATGSSPKDDSGLDLTQALPIIKSYGLPYETLWNYSNISNFSVFPPLSVYKSSSITTKTLIYTAISQTDIVIMNAIYANTPILFGFNVYQSFMTNAVAQTGVIPTPNPSIEQLEGGHCVSIVGWTVYNNIQCYIIRNSWGTNWGNTGAIAYNPNNGSNGGFAYIPKSYVLNPSLAYEFYSIKYQ
jgi:hypothetical protein